jgi:hypothetical protein
MSEPADRAGRALLAGALLAYLALSLVCWRSPGQAVGDTLVQETFAVSQIARMEEGRLPQLWSRIYHGNTSGILMVPYLWLFGRDWSVMRSWNVLFGALTLAAGWGLTRRLCGAKAAGLFAVLLAVHPTFVFGTRAGNSHVSLTVFFSLATLYCLARWWDSGGTAPLERRPGSSDGTAASEDAQLSFFSTHPALEELKRIDADTITPLEALQLLHRLSAMTRKEGT